MAPALSNDPEILAVLPELFKQWAESLPLADLLKLSERYGGTRLYIPTTLNGSPALVARLGEDAARRLIDFAGGDSVAVPRCDEAHRLVRGREALRLLEQERKTLGEIAQGFGVTDRTVSNWLKAERRRRMSIPPA